MPLFDKVDFTFGDNKKFTIIKKNGGKKISSILYGDQKITDYFITHGQLKQGRQLVITTR